ncbi:MAG TPA: N-acetylmuramoyl-L-alanine amidase [Phycisphaerae bacterium]|nr:hypothetical protein [Phycisphaerae bacterium]HOB74144.1 N-acetylmuramoyl-L-alanine amidase [Phycisphaerae bacterium]HOJ56413.1 N-acetylmuramoyl-L-alanine amidase [Phycisphaerae bacterium]HOL28243.1 N-acetylmuramoyl-L-alanine amidase [Phycisphaerae bacterium]HPP22498.1 N-acetylmuramoyl-L-alanine amidase [Phycisphaerae bacterium]
MQVFAAKKVAPVLVFVVPFLTFVSASAHEGDFELLQLPYGAGFEATTVKFGQDPREAKVAYVVERAGTLTTEDGRQLLPPGTVLDRLSVNDAGEASLWLTLAKGVRLGTLPESHIAAIDSVFRGLLDDGNLCGLNIQVREDGGADEYRSLGSYLAPEAPSPAPEMPAMDIPPTEETPLFEPQTIGGPLANADGQPTGALSGVVVYCAAGHGWTAGTSSWRLQRGVTHSMIEDYGNIDQLNYFVHYLYNAGATVVPLRPVGYQYTEVVLDNDHAGVTFTGSWFDSTSASKYYDRDRATAPTSVPYRFANASATENATARYVPNLPKSDFWPVYTWVAHGTNRVPQLYRIHHSGGTAEVVIDHRRVGNGWIWLGTYHFEAGTQGWVEISNLSSVSGVVIADAIRFGFGMGSIRRTSANSLSGYPRDEECQRYWAQSELSTHAVGFSSTIWDSSDTDENDNVSAGLRWSAEMNAINFNNDRWRRVYLEFHTNAASGSAKGTVALYNTEPGTYTTNQVAFATLLGEKIEADMLALDDGFEYSWGVRNPNTYHASFSYGAINALRNNNQFDATLLEVAFHDNAEDAANLRSARVRDAVARSSTQALVSFLSNASLFPGTQVPAVYLPDPPERLRATHDGNGNIVLSWVPGPARPASPASGDPATGYKIYRSSNGYGFGNAMVVGNVTTVTLTDIPADTTVYLRVAATNAGGESMPTPTLAVRRPASGVARVLIVDGFDRVSRQQNIVQTNYAGTHDRPIARRVNSFDYIVQHARAMDAVGATFDSCVNEAVIAGAVNLKNYGTVVWILGEESSADRTFDTTEQSLVTSYLNDGGRLFVTGSEIGYELDNLGAGRSFYENVLGANYVSDSAGTYTVSGTGGILADVGTFNFDPAQGAPYDVNSPDRIAPQAGAQAILTYSGGSGGTAGIQYDSGTYRVVMFGFPFEAITSNDARIAIMQRVLEYLAPVSYCVPRADFDCDGDVDQDDFGHLQACLTGSLVPVTDPDCKDAMLNSDQYIDRFDVEIFKNCMSGQGVPANPDCM